LGYNRRLTDDRRLKISYRYQLLLILSLAEIR
jgi:hypothetical protein